MYCLLCIFKKYFLAGRAGPIFRQATHARLRQVKPVSLRFAVTIHRLSASEIVVLFTCNPYALIFCMFHEGNEFIHLIKARQNQKRIHRLFNYATNELRWCSTGLALYPLREGLDAHAPTVLTTVALSSSVCL